MHRGEYNEMYARICKWEKYLIYVIGLNRNDRCIIYTDNSLLHETTRRQSWWRAMRSAKTCNIHMTPWRLDLCARHCVDPREEVLPHPAGTLHLSGSDISSGCLDLITRNKSPKGMTLWLLRRTKPEKADRMKWKYEDESIVGDAFRIYRGRIVQTAINSRISFLTFDDTPARGIIRRGLKSFAKWIPLSRPQSKENNYYEAYHD